MVKTEKGFTSVRRYDTWANYNADTERTETTISLIQQDQSIVVGDKRYSQNAECYVGSDVSGISTTGNWFLAGELTIKPHFDVNVVGSVQRTLGSGACGFFALGVRGSSTAAVINQFQWLCKVGGSVPQLRVVVDGFSVKLYCKVFGEQYANGCIRIYNQCNRYNKDAHKVCLFALKDSTTIIPEADMPSGTDIADVPYLRKTEAAAGSQKVLQTNAISSAERRVLLGENHETTQQDKVYKSSGLTYNPSTETLTVPTIKNPNSSWVHAAEGVAGQSGYVKVATIKINTVLTDQPLTIQFTGRNYLVPENIYILFNSENNTDPTLASFYYESGSTRFGEYLHKSATGTWDLYIRKGQGWDKIIVLSCENPYAFLSPNPNYSITWQDELVTTLPTDYVEAIMSTKRIHISGNANSANKLATPRSFKLGGGLNGTAVNFDGTGNVELEGGLKKVLSTNGNKYNYQYHRFLSIGSAETPLPATAQNYHFTFLVQSSETAEYEGILDINLRTNGSTQNNYLDCKWLLLSSNYSNYHPKIAYGHSNGAKTSYVDFFIVHRAAYKAYHFVLLSFNLRGMNVISDTHYTLYNSSEVGNTTATDKLTSSEVYASIAQAGQEIHGHTTDAGYSIVKDDTILDNVATFVGGFVNGAKTSNKLQTARKIGFANFDGTANVSLNNIQGKFQLRWATNTTQWQRVIRFKANAAYVKSSLVMAIQDIESYNLSGILNVYMGTTANTNIITTRISWLALNNKNGDFSRAFRAYATYPTDTDEYVYVDIYVNSQLTYTNMQFNVLTVYDTANLTIGNSGTWLEESAIPGSLIYTSKAESSLVPKQSLFATDSAFLQSLEGLCHKSNDSSLDLRRRAEYICGQQILSNTEEAGKAFYGSSANPLVISVPFKDPGDAVAGGKVNVNIIRFYYADTYWQELFFCVNTPNIYTRWVAGGNARPWYRMMKEDSTIEYNAWVQKATAADSAAVTNKTKYPIVFKRNGASITNWFADTTFAIDIPEELLDYSSPTGITLKVPDEAKKVANDLEIRVNGKQKATFNGSSAKTVNIEASRSHFVKASMYGESWTSPPAGATTPGVPLILDTSYMIPFGTLQDGDTIIMQVPNTLTSISGYPVYLRLDTTEGNVAGNLVKIIKGQNAGNPVEWKGTTALTAGYYHFVYSEGAGGLIFMYRNVSTS